MQYRCSKHSVILSETRMRRTRVTPLRYLAVTDASGGVASQQKIAHAHESPFFHYVQFPHPFGHYSQQQKIKLDTFWTAVYT
jgi:hypothetical protein